MSTRADRVEARLAGVDALLVTDLVNLRYLTGFTGSNGMAVIGPGLRRFITDSRYIARAVPGWDKEQGPQEFLTALNDLEGRIGFEDHKVPVRQFEKLKEHRVRRVGRVGWPGRSGAGSQGRR